MKHKIHGVDKNVCCAEQKIAYNLAFASRSMIIRANMSSEEAIPEMLRMFRLSYDYKPGRFDEQIIASALAAGFPKYREHFKLATNYEQIAEMFPLE